MSRPLPPRTASPVRRPSSGIRLPRPGTITVGELFERSRLTGRLPIELLATRILSGVPSEPFQHPFHRRRGDTARELATIPSDGLPPPTRDWFKLGNHHD